jgi:methylphosphotriester-DNA--protein-cysteine methyltransferase
MPPVAIEANANAVAPGPDREDAERWEALAARDPAWDGRFVYAVRTTGVYCRPSCAARTPRPENVSFHASCAEAEAAGFRPCRRSEAEIEGRDRAVDGQVEHGMSKAISQKAVRGPAPKI